MVLPDAGFDKCRPEGSHQYSRKHGDHGEILEGQVVGRYGCRAEDLGNDQIVAVIVEDQSDLDDKKLDSETHNILQIAPVCKTIGGGKFFIRTRKKHQGEYSEGNHWRHTDGKA